MSRLDARVRELERRLGSCRHCRPVIDLVYPGSARAPAALEHCEGCGEPRERISLLFSFDPHLGEKRKP